MRRPTTRGKKGGARERSFSFGPREEALLRDLANKVDKGEVKLVPTPRGRLFDSEEPSKREIERALRALDKVRK